MGVTKSPPKQPEPESLPTAYAVPVAAPIDAEALVRLTAPFANMSVAQCFRGPGWVMESGIACLIIVTPNARWVSGLNQTDGCALIAWRWNATPSMFLSLTVMKRPHVNGEAARWMGPSEGPVVQAIRREGRFRFCVALPSGRHSPWFEATFRLEERADHSYLAALEEQWTFPTPGLPYSQIGARFDPNRRERFGSDHREIPLWSAPGSDFWKTLSGDFPWSKDLGAKDRARIAWGYQAWRTRCRAAGRVQGIIDQQRLDGKPATFDSTGQLASSGSSLEEAVRLLKDHPKIARWFAAIAGPEPSAERAYLGALSVIRDPSASFAAVSGLSIVLQSLEDEIAVAAHASFAAALLDPLNTQEGAHRPWLANIGLSQLELRSTAIDLDAPLEDIENLWRGGFELIDLIDTGYRLASADFPAPFAEVCESLAVVQLEGSIEAAEEKIETLLREAQEARQWSIPWGARVEVRFGTFTAVRIFERDGEFSCHFLDAEDRYFHVAIGLNAMPARIAAAELVRKSAGGEIKWNTEADAALKLIAAAIVRDFLVVEERESVFVARHMRRRIRGREIRSVIYLPRVRYNRIHLESPPETEPKLRARHQVSPHLRRAEEASAAQRFLAQRYGFQLPQGFTFVRPHERGTLPETARVQTYRSRSASKMIFEELEAPPEGARPAWFDFEKDCASLLRARDLTVVHQAAHRDGDGGVDLYATDAAGQSWIIQCKCWATNRRVGPQVVRELEGAIILADHGSSKVSRGMIITTSSFSDGAHHAALILGFELIDGVELAALLARRL